MMMPGRGMGIGQPNGLGGVPRARPMQQPNQMGQGIGPSSIPMQQMPEMPPPQVGAPMGQPMNMRAMAQQAMQRRPQMNRGIGPSLGSSY